MPKLVRTSRIVFGNQYLVCTGPQCCGERYKHLRPWVGKSDLFRFLWYVFTWKLSSQSTFWTVTSEACFLLAFTVLKSIPGVWNRVLIILTPSKLVCQLCWTHSHEINIVFRTRKFQSKPLWYKFKYSKVSFKFSKYDYHLIRKIRRFARLYIQSLLTREQSEAITVQSCSCLKSYLLMSSDC